MDFLGFLNKRPVILRLSTLTNIYHIQIVVHRIPLHEIERLVTYDDGLCGNTLLAVKVNINKNKDCCNLLVYQCPSEVIFFL